MVKRDDIKALGGFFILMYFPLMIGLVWFDWRIMLKLLATNTILIFAIYLIEQVYDGN